MALNTRAQYSAEVKERVKIYISFTSVPSWQFLSCTSRTYQDKTNSEGTVHVVIHLARVRSWVYRLEWKFVCTLCQRRPQSATTWGTRILERRERQWGNVIGVLTFYMMRGAQIFQKSSSHLRILSSDDEVKQIPSWGLTNIRRHLKKFSYPDDPWVYCSNTISKRR